MSQETGRSAWQRLAEALGEFDADGRRPQGALAEELARLLQSWQENLRGHTGPECRVCPVCQAIAVVRQARPEVLDHLVNAAGEVAAAVRLAVGQPESTPPSGGRSKAPVEHIDVTD